MVCFFELIWFGHWSSPIHVIFREMKHQKLKLMILLLKSADHLSSSRLNKNVKRGPAAGLLLWRRDKQRRRRAREEETTEARANCQDVWARWQGNQSGWGVRFSKSSKTTFDIESIIFQVAGCRLRCFCNPRSQGQPGACSACCRKVNKQLQFV